MNLKNTSKLKKSLILEALETWNGVKKNKKGADIFADKMIKLGWEFVDVDDLGTFKDCLMKKSIIVKYASNNRCIESQDEMKREFEQYYIIPNKLRKYFPRIYVFDRGLLIQDKVLVRCDPDIKCNLSDVVDEFGTNMLNDYEHNHGHSRAGTVKFFDWVYKRHVIWINNIEIPLSYKGRLY